MGTDGVADSRARRDNIAPGTGRDTAAFEHASRGIDLELTVYVPMDDPIKISRLKIRNTSQKTRRLSVTAYVEWVLGPLRDRRGAVCRDGDRPRDGRDVRAKPLEYAVRFAAWRLPIWPDRKRNGPPTGASFSGGMVARAPAALTGRATLSGRVGAGLDPCGALQTAM